MLRSLPRAAPSSSSFRGPSIRTAFRLPKPTLPICTADARRQQTRSVAAHAISNPTLADIEKRWEGMPPQEQADLWMALRDRMKRDWHEMTLQERKAGTWLSWASRSWFSPCLPVSNSPTSQILSLEWINVRRVARLTSILSSILDRIWPSWS